MPRIRVGAVDDVPEGSGRAFVVSGHTIAVFRVEGVFYAIDDTCSHADASLSAGDLDTDDLCVECPLHGSQFDLRSGRPRSLPAFEPVATYPAAAEGADLFVEFPT